jgi:hypothetical protein
MLGGAVRQSKNMPVAQGLEGWGAPSISAPFCYTLIMPPPLLTEQRGDTVRKRVRATLRQRIWLVYRGELGRKVAYRRPVGLRNRRVQDFSDSFRNGILRSSPATEFSNVSFPSLLSPRALRLPASVPRRVCLGTHIEGRVRKAEIILKEGEV